MTEAHNALTKFVEAEIKEHQAALIRQMVAIANNRRGASPSAENVRDALRALHYSAFKGADWLAVKSILGPLPRPLRDDGQRRRP